MKNHFYFKIIHLLLCFSLLLPGTSAPLTIKSMPSGAPLTFENEFGRVDEIIPPKDGNWDNVIYHIQDAHCNFKAQKNISALLKKIITDEQVNLVCIEGASGKVSSKPISELGTPESRANLCLEYMEKGLLTGVESLKIQSPASFELYGVEEPILYLQNFQSFKEAIGPLKANQNWIKKYKAFIQKMEEKLFQGQLQVIDTLHDSYLNKEIKRRNFILELGKLIEKLKPSNSKVSDFLKNYQDESNYKIFKSILKLSKKEKSIDFDELETEFKALSLILESENNSSWIEFSKGNISKSTLFKSLHQKNRIQGEEYPQLAAYVKNLLLLKELKTEFLLPDIRKLIYQFKLALSSKEDEEELVKLSRFSRTLSRILELKLPHDEWEFFKKELGPLEIASLLKRTSSLADNLSIKWPKSMEDAQFSLDSALDSAKSYYVYLHQRDHTMVYKMFKRMERYESSKAIIITGGFHTAGLRKIIKKSGWGLVVLKPKVGPPNDLYFDVMMDEELNIDAALEQQNAGLARALILDHGLGLSSSKIISEMIAKLQGEGKVSKNAQVVFDEMQANRMSIMQLKVLLDFLLKETGKYKTIKERTLVFTEETVALLKKLLEEKIQKAKTRRGAKKTPGRIRHNTNSCYVATMLNMIVDNDDLKKHFLLEEDEEGPIADLKKALNPVIGKIERGTVVSVEEIAAIQRALHNLALIDTETSQEDPTSVLQKILELLKVEYLLDSILTREYESLSEVKGEEVTLLPGKEQDEAIIIDSLETPFTKVVGGQSMFVPIPSTKRTLQECINEAFDSSESTEVTVHKHVKENTFLKFTAKMKRSRLQLNTLPKTLYFERSSLLGSKMTGFEEYITVKGKVYRLKKVACHSGGRRGGHETSYLKRGEDWFYSDDMKSSVEDADITHPYHVSNIISRGRTFIYEEVNETEALTLSDHDKRTHINVVLPSSSHLAHRTTSSQNSPGKIVHNTNSCYVATMLNMIADVSEVKSLFVKPGYKVVLEFLSSAIKTSFSTLSSLFWGTVSYIPYVKNLISPSKEEELAPDIDVLKKLFLDAVKKVENGEVVSQKEIKAIQQALVDHKLIRSVTSQEDPASILQAILAKFGNSHLGKLTQISEYENLVEEDVVTLSPGKEQDEAIIIDDLRDPKSTVTQQQSMFVPIPLIKKGTIQECIDEAFDTKENAKVTIYKKTNGVNQYRKFTATKKQTTRRFNKMPKTLFFERSSLGAPLTGFEEYVKVKLGPDKYKVYRLKKIACHRGGPYSGHETTYLKRENEWFFSDDMESSVHDADISHPYHISNIIKEGRTFVYEEVPDGEVNILDNERNFIPYSPVQAKSPLKKPGIVTQSESKKSPYIYTMLNLLTDIPKFKLFLQPNKNTSYNKDLLHLLKNGRAPEESGDSYLNHGRELLTSLDEKSALYNYCIFLLEKFEKVDDINFFHNLIGILHKQQLPDQAFEITHGKNQLSFINEIEKKISKEETLSKIRSIFLSAISKIEGGKPVPIEDIISIETMLKENGFIDLKSPTPPSPGALLKSLIEVLDQPNSDELSSFISIGSSQDTIQTFINLELKKHSSSKFTLPSTFILNRSKKGAFEAYQKYIKLTDSEDSENIYQLKKVSCRNEEGHEIIYIKRKDTWFCSDQHRDLLYEVDLSDPTHAFNIIKNSETFIYEELPEEISQTLKSGDFEAQLGISKKTELIKEGLIKGLAEKEWQPTFNVEMVKQITHFIEHPSPWTIREMGIDTPERLEKVIANIPESKVKAEIENSLREAYPSKLLPAVARLLELKSGLSKEYFDQLNIGNKTVQDFINKQLENIDRLIKIITEETPEQHGYDRVVIFPTVARGDMNAYKYVPYVEGENVFTIVLFHDRPNELDGLSQNSNMGAFMQHLDSEPDFNRENYIFLPFTLMDSNFRDHEESLRDTLEGKDGGADPMELNENKNLLLRDYDKYDSVVYEEKYRTKIQERLDDTSKKTPCKEVIAKLNKKITENFVGHNKHLVIININGRIDYSKPYDPREQRHSIDPEILRAMIESAKEKGCVVMLVGDEIDSSLDDLSNSFLDGTQLWNEGLNRHQQRATMYGMTKGFTSSLYLGMQSGVNEDAVLLHNTNVFSISENIGSGQVGRDRVQKKMELFSWERPTSPYNNFFTLEHTALLTDRGRLAAFQLQANQRAKWSMTYREFFIEDDKHVRQKEILEDEYEDSNLQKHSMSLLDHEFAVQSDDETDTEDESSSDEETFRVTRRGIKAPREKIRKRLRLFKKLRRKSSHIFESTRGTVYRRNDIVDSDVFLSLIPKGMSNNEFLKVCDRILERLRLKNVLDEENRLLLDKEGINGLEMSKIFIDFNFSGINFKSFRFSTKKIAFGKKEFTQIKDELLNVEKRKNIFTKSPIRKPSRTANKGFRKILRDIHSEEGIEKRKRDIQGILGNLIENTIKFEEEDPETVRLGTPRYTKRGKVYNAGLFFLIRNIIYKVAGRREYPAQPSGTLRPTGKADSPAYLKELKRLKQMEPDFRLKLKQTREQAKRLGKNNFVIEYDFGDESNIPAYNFTIGENQHLIVLNTNAQLRERLGPSNLERIQEEALYHEEKEVQWMDVLVRKFGNQDLAHRWSHIISSSLQVSKYGKEGLTPFHEVDLASKTAPELEALIKEYYETGRQEQYDIMQWAIDNSSEVEGDFDLNLRTVKEYEARYIRAAKEMLLAKLNLEVTTLGDLAEDVEDQPALAVKGALIKVKENIELLKTQETLLAKAGLSQKDLDNAYLNLEKRLYTMANAPSKETRSSLTRVGWYLGKENQVGFDINYLNALRGHEDLLVKALLKAGLESVSTNLKSPNLSHLLSDKKLDYYELSFHIVRQLEDLVPSLERPVFQQKVFALLQQEAISEEEYLELFGEFLDKEAMDYGLLDNVIKAMKRSTESIDQPVEATHILLAQLYQEILSINSEEVTLDKDQKLKAILLKLGLGQYEVDSIVVALRDLLKFTVYDSVKNQLEMDDSGRLETFLGLLGSRILDGKYSNRQARKMAIKAFTDIFHTWVSKTQQKTGRLSRGFTQAMEDNEVDLVSFDYSGLKPETQQVFKRLNSQSKKWQEVMEFLSSSKSSFTFIRNVSLVKKGNKTYLRMNVRHQTIDVEQSELMKEKGRSLKEIVSLYASIQVDPETYKGGMNLRNESIKAIEGTEWETNNRKALLMVSGDDSPQELLETINLIKKMQKADALGHIKLFGDSAAFLDKLDQLGMLRNGVTRELLTPLFVAEEDIGAYHDDKPLVILGKGPLKKFSQLKKTIYLDSSKSLNGSIVGAMAFLTKNEAMLNQLESQIELEESKSIITNLKAYVSEGSDLKLTQLEAPLTFVMPRLKPLLDKILSQLADEEETILISG